jgi:hypothetical protein
VAVGLRSGMFGGWVAPARPRLACVGVDSGWDLLDEVRHRFAFLAETYTMTGPWSVGGKSQLRHRYAPEWGNGACRSFDTNVLHTCHI